MKILFLSKITLLNFWVDVNLWETQFDRLANDDSRFFSQNKTYLVNGRYSMVKVIDSSLFWGPIPDPQTCNPQKRGLESVTSSPWAILVIE